MRYHYYVHLIGDNTHVASKSETNPDRETHGSFKTEEQALDAGEEMKNVLPEDVRANFTVSTYPVAQTVEEQDILEGHAYPGHETWRDADGLENLYQFGPMRD